MEKSKDSYGNFDRYFGYSLNWASLIIVLVCLVGFIVIISYLTLHEINPIVNEVNIITDISNNDTLTRTNIEIAEYFQKVEKSITDLQNVESNLDKKINEINDFYKFLGVLLGFIIALTGFFGFKSLHELKIRNLENAKEIAKIESKSKVETELTNLDDKIKSAIELAKSEANLKILSDFYQIQSTIEGLKQNIDEILSRLDTVDRIEDDYEDLLLRLEDVETGIVDSQLKPARKNKTSTRKSKKADGNSTGNLPFNEDKFGEEDFVKQ